MKRRVALNFRHKLIISSFLKQEEDGFDFLGMANAESLPRQPGGSLGGTLQLITVDTRGEKWSGHVHLEELFPRGIFEV